MNLSLQARAAVLVTLVIVAVTAVSTVLFTSAYSRSKERNRIMRGETLAYTLSKAAAEGMLTENLDLLRKASHVIQAPDVTGVQVFSPLWDCIDAYPFDRFGDAPLPEAVAHFKMDRTSVHYLRDKNYDFYEPVLFRPSETVPPVVIGYARLSLSSLSIRREIQNLVLSNILIAAAISILAIVLITLLIRRLMVHPILVLHEEIAAFRSGSLPDRPSLTPSAPHELQDLERAFHELYRSVRDKEQKLTESGRRIHNLFERVEHGIFRIDQQGEIVEANARFRSLFGDVSGLCDILIGDQVANECLHKAARDGKFSIEDKAVGKDGDELMVSLSLYPDPDGRGGIGGFDGYVIDITEKKRLEERLMRAQKLEAVGTLAGGMAHDFNNLLTAILGYSGIILKTTKEDDPVHKPATIIHNAAKRGAEFGKKILTITRKEKLETKPVNLNEIVTAALELLQRSMPKSIEIVTHLASDLPITNADPAQLQQVIINLAVNARDAMPDGGKLVIETETVGSESADNGKHSSAGFLKLSVSDTGAGIETEAQTRIFDPFYTTKDVGKGTGLGLYIVQSIVSSHGGYINLYSEPSRGTRFSVYLPITKTGGTESRDVPDDLRGSGSILVIDDEPDVRELCKDILVPLGYTVHLADGGQAGVAVLRDLKSRISLVILDMIMPKMSGTDTFNALRAVDPDTRVLLYSGYSHKNFAGIDELLKRGAVGFIQKPFSNVDLALAVKKALLQPKPDTASRTSGQS